MSSDWTQDEWDNLESLSKKLKALMDNPLPNNQAWVISLRLTIQAISMYVPENGN